MPDQSSSEQAPLCENCGEVFSDFLKQMAEHNEKIVCAKCGHIHESDKTKHN